MILIICIFDQKISKYIKWKNSWEKYLGKVRWILGIFWYYRIQIVVLVLFWFLKFLLAIQYILLVHCTLQPWKSKGHLGLFLLSNMGSNFLDESRTWRGLKLFRKKWQEVRPYHIRVPGRNLPLGVFIIIDGGLKG